MEMQDHRDSWVSSCPKFVDLDSTAERFAESDCITTPVLQEGGEDGSQMIDG
jgi:hypothetical protein